MKLAFLVALVASMPTVIQASDPETTDYHVIDYLPTTATLSGNHAWSGDASKVIDGRVQDEDENGIVMVDESDALTYSTKDTCNVATADLGYIKVDLGMSQEVDGVRLTMVGERAYCNMFLNVWDEGQDEPVEPLSKADITLFPTPSLTVAPTPSPTVAPTSSHKATTAPTTAKAVALRNTKKTIWCQVCSGPKRFCEKLFSPKQCNHPNNYCINVLDNHLDGTRSVDRKCANFDTCYREWFEGTSDDDKCRDYDPADQQFLDFHCTFCCINDKCNTPIRPTRADMYIPVRRRQLTETAQNSNIYNTGTDHKYGPVLSKEGEIIVPIVPRRTVRYIKLWVGTNSVTKTGGGVYEIEALSSEFVEADEEEFDTAMLEDEDYSVVDVTFPPGGTTKSSFRTASSSGDPHFKLWNGGKFDFHGGCDLVLLDSPRFRNSVGLTIHIRTKIETWWSYIDSGALKIGEDALEIAGGELDSGRAWVNGNPQDLADGDEFILGGFPVVYHKVGPVQSRYRIDLGNGDAMSMETFKSFVRVNVRAKNLGTFEGALGMMGSYPSGGMMGRDGVSVIDDPDAFGKEWQVQASEPMLFHDTVGVQHPQECAMPDVSTKNKRRRLGESLITQQDAETACQHVEEEEHDACVFDVLATNDKDMAGAY